MSGAASEKALVVSGLVMRFGGVEAVSNLDFQVKPGEITGVIGPNGAGKTTVFNVVTGVYKPTAGTIMLGEKKISGLPPHRVAKLGVTRTFQTVRVFGGMTVLENVMIGRHSKTKAGILSALFKTPWERIEERKIREDSMRELEFVGLADVADRRCDTLPLGHLRLVEIARALAAEPQFILLDEPAAGLNPKETSDLGDLVRKILGRNVTPILVDHDMDLVMDVCKKIVVLNYGAKIAEGGPREIQNNPAVIAAYLGDDSLKEGGDGA